MELIADGISQPGNMKSFTLVHGHECLACRGKALAKRIMMPRGHPIVKAKGKLVIHRPI